MKKLFSLFAVVMMAVMSLNLSALTVSAEEPTTYVVKYDAEDDYWYYQVGNKWDKDIKPDREMYYMTLEMKDGDHVVVEAPEGNPTLELDFHLGSLTVGSGDTCTIDVKSIQDCYILTGATANIDCKVTNGYVYDEVAANFLKDCDNLEIIYTYGRDYKISVNVLGTCKSFKMSSDVKVKYTGYDFRKPLSVYEGELVNEDDEYTTTPSAAAPAPAAPAPAAPAPSTSDNEYDSVPKTGQSTSSLFAFGLAAVCFLGSYALKKRS